MTQRRQISVHLGMTLLIPLKSDSSLMLLSTFIQRQKTFLCYEKICSTSMLSFLAECFLFLIFVTISSLEILFLFLIFCSNFLFGNSTLYLLGMFLILLNIGTFCNIF